MNKGKCGKKDCKSPAHAFIHLKDPEKKEKDYRTQYCMTHFFDTCNMITMFTTLNMVENINMMMGAKRD